LVELGLSDNQPLRETILIRAGMYCGRRFEAAGAHAVWFIEEDQLKLFSADGNILRVLDRVAAQEPDMRAAA
jgi:hypothetical protein